MRRIPLESLHGFEWDFGVTFTTLVSSCTGTIQFGQNFHNSEIILVSTQNSESDVTRLQGQTPISFHSKSKSIENELKGFSNFFNFLEG